MSRIVRVGLVMGMIGSTCGAAGAQDASFRRLATEMGTIVFAAEACGYRLSAEFGEALEAGRTTRFHDAYQQAFDDGYAQGRAALALGGEEMFCSASCLAHGPGGSRAYAVC